jgi:hypothetical protein
MPLELVQIRRRVQHRLADIKRAAAERRGKVAAAERAYEAFLADVATPLMNAVAQSLSAEGYAYRVTTPGGAVRMASDRSSRTYLEIRLDTAGREPQVVAEVGRERGSRVFADERLVCPGVAIDAITDIQAECPWGA